MAYDKILITGKIEVVTGMHIGTGGEFAAIGAVDSPVIRDAKSGLPIIPGSTLKGKLRSMLVRKYCPRSDNPNNDDVRIKRMFGGDFVDKGQKIIKASRLIFSDMILSNMEDLKSYNIDSSTEVKFENTINRVTAVANPRQIERVIKGAEFNFEILYNLENETEAKEDMKLLTEAIKMLEYDYLGGHGSRGYGRVKFADLKAESKLAGTDVTEFNKALKGVYI